MEGEGKELSVEDPDVVRFEDRNATILMLFARSERYNRRKEVSYHAIRNTQHAIRNTFHVSRLTVHGSCFTFCVFHIMLPAIEPIISCFGAR